MLDTEVRTEGAGSEAPMVGDHLALDMLNTEARVDGNIVDYWSSNDHVLAWLKRYSTDLKSTLAPADLLTQARALRTLARELIVRHKGGEAVDIGGLNKYLNAYQSAPYLERDSEGKWIIARTTNGETTASLLGPVAESVAQILVDGNFELVKQCEHPDCILWFYDRTKAHKRRWCSMALCGNRYKAAQFRKRSSGDRA
jgi:predicted RNA-binding Zn ribbon-like protein